jgi:DNA-binding ferritin-like protein
MSKKELLEKASDQVGGGVTGGSKSADPVATGNAHANRGADKSQGETASKKLEGEVQTTDSDNNTAPTGDTAAKNKASVAAKPSAASSTMKEEIDGLFGDDLSEEFKDKASIIFEAAVASRIAEERTALEEEFAAKQTELEESFEAAKAELTEELSEQVSDYLDYVVEQWMETNEVAIESSLNAMIAEEFIEKLKGLFEESYITVPAEKMDLVAEMAERVQELEEALNTSIDENIELSKIVEAASQKEVFDEVSEGLAMTQVEKLRTLAEGVEFDSADTYRAKLEIVKEQYFGEKKTVAAKLIEENEIVELDESVVTPTKAAGQVAGYVSAIARTVKK